MMFRSEVAMVIACAVAVAFSAASIGHSRTLDGLSFDQKLALALAGDADAQIAVAHNYESGTDVGINAAEAASWYRKAADQGNVEAMFGLARLFSRGAQGVEKSPESAAKLYEAAALRGHREAQNALGYCYQHGIGIEQSHPASVKWYTEAANAGLPAAQSNLGLMYLAGKGVQADIRKAFELFDQAAKQGDVWGLNNLGGLYEMGWGVGQDRQTALAYYQRAVEGGNKTAERNLERLSAALLSKPAGGDVRLEGAKSGEAEAINSETKVDFRAMPPAANRKSSIAEPAIAEPKKTKAETRSRGKKQARPAGRQPSASNKSQRRQNSNRGCQRSFLERLFLGRNCD